MSYSRGCAVIYIDERCSEPYAYTVWADDCEACQGHGFLMCAGHRACIKHAAKMRAGLYKWRADLSSKDVVVSLVTS